MGTSTYTALANVTLASASAGVTFSSISGSYRDLILVINGATSDSTERSVVARFNSDTGSNYSNVQMYSYAAGGGGIVSDFGSDTSLGLMYMPSSSTSGIYGVSISQIMDYSATDKQKTVLARENTTGSSTSLTVGKAARWASTSAITSIYLFVNGGYNFASGSTFALYGIAA